MDASLSEVICSRNSTDQSGNSKLTLGGGHKCVFCGVYFKTGSRRFHRFPKDPKMSNKWAEVSGKKWVITASISTRYSKFRVCSDHFESKDYMGKKKSLLNPDAIPHYSVSVIESPVNFSIMKAHLKEKLHEDVPSAIISSMDSSETLWRNSNLTPKSSTPKPQRIVIPKPRKIQILRYKLHYLRKSPTDYHPALAPLSWLFGVWESVEAEASYPTISSLKYNEIMEFQPTAQPFLEYKSEAWHPVKRMKLHCEKGFLRISPNSKKVAFVVSHNFGLSELSEGSVENDSLCLESQSISRMSFSKNAVTVKLVRKLALKGEKLYSTVLMETVNQPLQTHLQCTYVKKIKKKK